LADPSALTVPHSLKYACGAFGDAFYSPLENKSSLVMRIDIQRSFIFHAANPPENEAVQPPGCVSMEIQLSEIKTRYGVLSVPNSGGDVIGRHLARYGEWGWDEVCFIASVLPSENARVLDVGAFIGTFGIGLSQLRKLKYLCFVEANTNVSSLLKRNVQRIFEENEGSSRTGSRLKPIVIEALLAPPGASLVPGISALKNLGSTAFLPSTSDEASVIAPPPARVLALADLRDKYGDFDLIKLDAEGMELEILRSDARELSQGNTTLWIECNENPRSLEIMNLLASWELDVYYFAFPAHNPDNLYNDPIPIFPFAYEAALLIAPKVRPVLDNTLQAHHCILQSVASARDLKEALWHTPRWGMREWVGATPEGIVALACRSIAGETYESYLLPGARKRNSIEIQNQHAADVENLASDLLKQLENVKQQAAAYENQVSLLSARLEECQKAETSASERLAMLDAERQHSEEVEEMLASSSARVLDLLAILEKVQEQKLNYEKRLSFVSAELEDVSAKLEKGSTELEERRKESAYYMSRALSAENSLSWKITKPLRESIGRNSQLGGWLRLLKSKVSRALNRFK
jgi:FkbM family methyltransferase